MIGKGNKYNSKPTKRSSWEPGQKNLDFVTRNMNPNLNQTINQNLQVSVLWNNKRPFSSDVQNCFTPDFSNQKRNLSKLTFISTKNSCKKLDDKQILKEKLVTIKANTLILLIRSRSEILKNLGYYSLLLKF